MGIRPIEVNDIGELMRLASAMHQESIYREMAFDPQTVMGLFASAMDARKPAVWGVTVTRGDEVIGFGLGACGPNWFGPDMLASDLAIYIDPEHRGGSAGPRLMQAFTDWANSTGAKLVMVGVSAGINPERTGRLYERLGYGDPYTIYRHMK